MKPQVLQQKKQYYLMKYFLMPIAKKQILIYLHFLNC
nr:MAG TPA: hypothetical protein [Caudoviricetes sp.]